MAWFSALRIESQATLRTPRTCCRRCFSVCFAMLEKEESYLRRAAINTAIDVIRSRQAHQTVELLEEPTGLAHDSGELRQALGSALARLKQRPAEIFALRFLEGFSNPQIAQMLGLSRVLVAVIVHRSRQQLRKELSAYLGDRS